MPLSFRQAAFTVASASSSDDQPIRAPFCSESCYKHPMNVKGTSAAVKEPSFTTLEQRLLLKLWGIVEWAQRESTSKFATHVSTGIPGVLSAVTTPSASPGDSPMEASGVLTPLAGGGGDFGTGKSIPSEQWPCAVAKLMGSRTCRDVWWYRQSLSAVLVDGDARCLCPRQGVDPAGPRCKYCSFFEEVLDAFTAASKDVILKAHAAQTGSSSKTSVFPASSIAKMASIASGSNDAEGGVDGEAVGEDGTAIAPVRDDTMLSCGCCIG